MPLQYGPTTTKKCTWLHRRMCIHRNAKMAKKRLTEMGFEPMHTNILAPEANAIDHSATQPYRKVLHYSVFITFTLRIFRISKNPKSVSFPDKSTFTSTATPPCRQYVQKRPPPPPTACFEYNDGTSLVRITPNGSPCTPTSNHVACVVAFSHNLG